MRELEIQEIEQVSGGSLLGRLSGIIGVDLGEAARGVGREIGGTAVRGAGVGGLFGAGFGAGRTLGGLGDRVRGLIGGLRGQ